MFSLTHSRAIDSQHHTDTVRSRYATDMDTIKKSAHTARNHTDSSAVDNEAAAPQGQGHSPGAIKRIRQKVASADVRSRSGVTRAIADPATSVLLADHDPNEVREGESNNAVGAKRKRKDHRAKSAGNSSPLIKDEATGYGAANNDEELEAVFLAEMRARQERNNPWAAHAMAMQRRAASPSENAAIDLSVAKYKDFEVRMEQHAQQSGRPSSAAASARGVHEKPKLNPPTGTAATTHSGASPKSNTSGRSSVDPHLRMSTFLGSAIHDESQMVRYVDDDVLAKAAAQEEHQQIQQHSVGGAHHATLSSARDAQHSTRHTFSTYFEDSVADVDHDAVPFGPEDSRNESSQVPNMSRLGDLRHESRTPQPQTQQKLRRIMHEQETLKPRRGLGGDEKRERRRKMINTMMKQPKAASIRQSSPTRSRGIASPKRSEGVPLTQYHHDVAEAVTECFMHGGIDLRANPALVEAAAERHHTRAERLSRLKNTRASTPAMSDNLVASEIDEIEATGLHGTQSELDFTLADVSGAPETRTPGMASVPTLALAAGSASRGGSHTVTPADAQLPLPLKHHSARGSDSDAGRSVASAVVNTSTFSPSLLASGRTADDADLVEYVGRQRQGGSVDDDPAGQLSPPTGAKRRGSQVARKSVSPPSRNPGEGTRSPMDRKGSEARQSLPRQRLSGSRALDELLHRRGTNADGSASLTSPTTASGVRSRSGSAGRRGTSVATSISAGGSVRSRSGSKRKQSPDSDEGVSGRKGGKGSKATGDFGGRPGKYPWDAERLLGRPSFQKPTFHEPYVQELLAKCPDWRSVVDSGAAKAAKRILRNQMPIQPTERVAVVIGVSEFDDDAFSSCPQVAEDAHRLSDTLHRAGYAVERLIGRGGEFVELPEVLGEDGTGGEFVFGSAGGSVSPGGSNSASRRGSMSAVPSALLQASSPTTPAFAATTSPLVYATADAGAAGSVSPQAGLSPMTGTFGVLPDALQSIGGGSADPLVSPAAMSMSCNSVGSVRTAPRSSTITTRPTMSNISFAVAKHLVHAHQYASLLFVFCGQGYTKDVMLYSDQPTRLLVCADSAFNQHNTLFPVDVVGIVPPTFAAIHERVDHTKRDAVRASAATGPRRGTAAETALFPKNPTGYVVDARATLEGKNKGFASVCFEGTQGGHLSLEWPTPPASCADVFDASGGLLMHFVNRAFAGKAIREMRMTANSVNIFIAVRMLHRSIRPYTTATPYNFGEGNLIEPSANLPAVRSALRKERRRKSTALCGLRGAFLVSEVASRDIPTVRSSFERKITGTDSYHMRKEPLSVPTCNLTGSILVVFKTKDAFTSGVIALDGYAKKHVKMPSLFEQQSQTAGGKQNAKQMAGERKSFLAKREDRKSSGNSVSPLRGRRRSSMGSHRGSGMRRRLSTDSLGGSSDTKTEDPFTEIPQQASVGWALDSGDFGAGDGGEAVRAALSCATTRESALLRLRIDVPTFPPEVQTDAVEVIKSYISKKSLAAKLYVECEMALVTSERAHRKLDRLCKLQSFAPSLICEALVADPTLMARIQACTTIQAYYRRHRIQKRYLISLMLLREHAAGAAEIVREFETSHHIVMTGLAADRQRSFEKLESEMRTRFEGIEYGYRTELMRKIAQSFSRIVLNGTSKLWSVRQRSESERRTPAYRAYHHGIQLYTMQLPDDERLVFADAAFDDIGSLTKGLLAHREDRPHLTAHAIVQPWRPHGAPIRKLEVDRATGEISDRDVASIPMRLLATAEALPSIRAHFDTIRFRNMAGEKGNLLPSPSLLHSPDPSISPRSSAADAGAIMPMLLPTEDTVVVRSRGEIEREEERCAFLLRWRMATEAVFAVGCASVRIFAMIRDCGIDELRGRYEVEKEQHRALLALVSEQRRWLVVPASKILPPPVNPIQGL